MIRPVEVQVVDVRRGPFQIEVAPAGVRLGAVRQIPEGHEQSAHVVVRRVDERRERERLSLQRELEGPHPAHPALLAGRRGHLDDELAGGRRLQRRGHAVVGVDREVRERRERGAFAVGHGRLGRLAHEAVLLGPPRADFVRIRLLGRAARGHHQQRQRARPRVSLPHGSRSSVIVICSLIPLYLCAFS